MSWPATSTHTWHITWGSHQRKSYHLRALSECSCCESEAGWRDPFSGNGAGGDRETNLSFHLYIHRTKIHEVYRDDTGPASDCSTTGNTNIGLTWWLESRVLNYQLMWCASTESWGNHVLDPVPFEVFYCHMDTVASCPLMVGGHVPRHKINKICWNTTYSQYKWQNIYNKTSPIYNNIYP